MREKKTLSPGGERGNLRLPPAVDRGFRVGLCFGRHFRTVSDTFCKHEVHVGDPDEAGTGSCTAQPVGWGIFMNTATAGQHDGTLVFHQTFRAIFGVTEGNTSASHRSK